MGVLYLLLWGCLWGRPIRRVALLRRRGIPWRGLYHRLAWGMGLSIYACMAGQLMLLWRMGAWDWRQALPLHLCSFMGLITLPVLLFRWRTGWGFGLLLGVPGALGALIYPCVLPCPWQGWMDFCFLSLHSLLVIAPFLGWAAGLRPDGRLLWPVMAWGNVFLAAVLIVNQLSGANFLFLRAAPAGTPLAWLHRGGVGGYILGLEMLALGILTLELRLYGKLTKESACR